MNKDISKLVNGFDVACLVIVLAVASFLVSAFSTGPGSGAGDFIVFLFPAIMSFPILLAVSGVKAWNALKLPDNTPTERTALIIKLVIVAVAFLAFLRLYWVFMHS